MHRTIKLAAALLTLMVSLAAETLAAQAVVATPTNQQGWVADNMLGAATIGITSAFARSGDGSLEMTSTGTGDRSRFSLYLQNPFSFAGLTGVGMDLYNSVASVGNGVAMPALKLLTYDPLGAFGQFGELAWEQYLNSGVSPAGTWATEDMSQQLFWRSAGGGKRTQTNCMPVLNGPNMKLSTLADWQSTCYSSQAVVYGISVGYGSGNGGVVDMAVDNIWYTESGNDYSVNFEANVVTATPEPATLALMFTGLLGIVPLARRKRRQQ